LTNGETTADDGNFDGREHGFDGSSNGTDLRNHPSIGFNRCFPAPPARDSPKIVA
jgi:hypothetical protein